MLLEQCARHLAASYPAAEVRRAAAHDRPAPPLAKWAADYLPSYFPIAPSLFHRWLVSELSSLHLTRGQRLNVLAPRGAAKSTWSTFAYPLWAALHGIEPYIILTSDTGDQAHKYLDSIRTELESNESIANDYPHLFGTGPVWRQDRIRLNNGVQIEAIGTGTKLRGRKSRQHRPSLILVDDPQNTNHIVSELQRQRSWDWLTKDVCCAGDPATNIIVLGTALHRECIVCRNQMTPGWRSKLFRSIISWPERMDLWREWEDILFDHECDEREANALVFYQSHKKSMDKGAVVLWPQREPLYALMMLRATIGVSAFNSEKQNDPADPSACEWPPEYFDRADLWFDEWPANLAVKTVALDPSKGRDARRGDYSAIVMFGRDGNQVEYVEADLARRPVDPMCFDLAKAVKRFRPDGVMLEGNAWQELLAAPITAAFAAERVEATITTCENTAPKLVRIRRLTRPLCQRKMRFKRRSPGTALLVQQLQDFPNASHDDGCDALEMSRRLAIELSNAKRTRR